MVNDRVACFTLFDPASAGGNTCVRGGQGELVGMGVGERGGVQKGYK